MLRGGGGVGEGLPFPLHENKCLAALPCALDLLNIHCTPALLSGVYGRGLNTGVLSGVVEDPCHSSNGVRFWKSSLLTIVGEYSEDTTVDRPSLTVDHSLKHSGDSGTRSGEAQAPSRCSRGGTGAIGCGNPTALLTICKKIEEPPPCQS